MYVSVLTAGATLMFKSGALQETSSYRPISTLPATSKFIDKIAAKQIFAYFNNENLMQFGFRANHPTETAECCYVLEAIRACLDKGGVVGVVFLDLHKGF